MSVNQASNSDKEKILDFCKNTFSWGDYIGEVWDYWVSEGNLLVIHEKSVPIAMCHASHNAADRNMWVEGIRVHPQYRQQGHAKNLIKHCEKISHEKNFNTIQMLIETNNSNSINLAKTLEYHIKETWDFYSLDNSIKQKPHEIDFSINTKREKLLLTSEFSYVDSWRWYKLTKDHLNNLEKEKRIIFSEINDSINGIAILTESQHFDKTLIITILTGDNDGITKILSDVMVLSEARNYKRIQILTKQKSLPQFKGLEKKLSFHLVEKNL